MHVVSLSPLRELGVCTAFIETAYGFLRVEAVCVIRDS